MRIVFCGTAELACPSLVALSRQSWAEIALVITQPDRPGGRALKLQPSPLKREATRLGLPLAQPAKIRDADCQTQLRALAPDVLVVVAYGQLLPGAILELPRAGCVNVHTSLLPKYRGAAPIQWAMLNDEKETGVTLMQMDRGLDTGAIISQQTTPIHDTDTAASLHDRLAELGAQLLVDVLPSYLQGDIAPRPQPELREPAAAYARKIEKADGHLNWHEPARSLWNRVRALNPWPGTFAFYDAGEGRRLIKIVSAELCEAGSPTSAGMVSGIDRQGVIVGCGFGRLCLTTLQREGGRPLPALEFVRGFPIKPGDRFT